MLIEDVVDFIWRLARIVLPLPETVVLMGEEERVFRNYAPYTLVYDHETFKTKIAAGEILGGVELSRLSAKILLNGNFCECCGLEGKEWRLGKYEKDILPVWNLFGFEDGKPVLLNRDHIFPRSIGGSNELTNMRTTCVDCNERKGSTMPDEPGGFVCNERLVKVLATKHGFTRFLMKNVDFEI